MLKKFVALLLVCVVSSISFLSVFAQSGTVIDVEVENTDEVTEVNFYGDLNPYSKFTFSGNSFNENPLLRDNSSPSSKWDLDSKGKYTIDGYDDNGKTLYTSYYFTNIVGKTLKIKASCSNVTFDLVHKGALTQTVAYTWTVDAGKETSVKISSTHIGSYAAGDNYYIRFNTNPFNNNSYYRITGTIE